MSDEPAEGARPAPRERLTPVYPPAEHMLRDLGIAIERRGNAYQAELEIVSEACTGAGSVRAGVIGTLVDVVAGGHAARQVAPSWIATCDMKLHLLRAARSGRIVAQTNVLRSGRSTVVLEAQVETDATSEPPVALGTVTFSVLEPRGALQRMEDAGDDGPAVVRTEFATSSSGLRASLPDTLGARILDASLGVVEMPLLPYSSNTMGALQGGALATLVDLSAEAAGRALGDPDWITTDLNIDYLALSKVGPIRSRAQLLRRNAASALMRVEVRDAGADDRLVSVASAEVGPA